MLEPKFHRTQLLVGEDNLSKIKNARVVLFGVGGVGSWCAEGLVRSGISNLTIVDSDRVCVTNINRQLQATVSSVGKVKVDELRDRLLDINPDASILALQEIYSAETSGYFKLYDYDYIIDAIDSLSNKIHLIETALSLDKTLFASMGAALKLDPTKIKIDSIWKTSACPLAREIRKALRKKNVHKDFLCVYSEEIIAHGSGGSFCGTGDCICPQGLEAPGKPELVDHEWCSKKIRINGSVAHITAIFGFMLASLVIDAIINNK